jgi:hypothetical protein
LRLKIGEIIILLSHFIYIKHSLKVAIFSINFAKIKRKNGKISNNFGQKKDKFSQTPLHQNKTPFQFSKVAFRDAETPLYFWQKARKRG